jgi:hypothetical protein
LNKVSGLISATLWRIVHSPEALSPDAGLSDIVACVETALVLARREGCRDASRHALSAEDRYPLPTRTRRVLREEPDPNGGDCDWRWNGGLEFRSYQNVMGQWHTITIRDGTSDRVFAPYPDRISLWYSLMREPYRTETVQADEQDPWGEKQVRISQCSECSNEPSCDKCCCPCHGADE